MSIRGKISLVLFLTAVLFGCSKIPDPKPAGQYQAGVIVVNEGSFSNSNGSISYFNPVTELMEQNILPLNAAHFTGDVAQSITFSGGKAYIVLNGDNKIEVVEEGTFKSLDSITTVDMIAPRYVEVIDNKAYVSVWGPYDENYALFNSYILVYDLSTKKTVTKIETDEGVENLLFNGKYLFASCYNFGESHTVAVIDPSTNTLVKEIHAGSGPSGSVQDANGDVWVVSTGTGNEDPGQLFRINATTLMAEDSIALPAQAGSDLAISVDKRSVFYSIGNSVFQVSVTAKTAPTSSLFDAAEVITFYGFNVDPATGNIWVADAFDYASPGKVFIYDPSGVYKRSYEVGISPGFFAFR